MSAKNTTRSMTSFKGHCDKKAKKIDDFLSANPDPNSEVLQELKRLNADLEDQLKRMEVSIIQPKKFSRESPKIRLSFRYSFMEAE